MSKKKKAVITIALLSSIAMAFLGGQSYSKYVSEVKGYGSAQIATWNFKVNGEKEAIQTINLGTQINNQTLLDNKIAPGTEGSFNITIDSTGSDVGINYNIKFEDETTKPTNLKFIYNGEEHNNISELGETLSGTINANDQDKTKVYTINWKWPYETGSSAEEKAKNDKIDTKEAQEITSYSFNVSVTGTQVNPQNS